MQRLLLFLTFMGLGTGLVYLLTVRESPPRPASVSDLPSNVLAMKRVTVRQHEHRRIKYELFADEAIFDERSETGSLKRVRFRIYDTQAKGKHLAMRGRAQAALLDKKSGTVILIGKVRLRDDLGSEIRSQRIEYDQRKERIVAPGRVWVKARDTVHEGQSLVYEIPQQRMTFTAPKFYQ